nr:hypothetical protein BaRGS_031800 [Batillaria attramentaria]
MAEPSTSAESDPQTSSPPETKCRKSSRIKAKLSKLEAEAADAKNNEKYNLRLSSLVKRVQVEQRQSTPKEPKGKSKPPPLSKYRRRTANARERMRMQDINEGFEQLRDCLPEMDQQERGDKKGKKEKLTKYMILSLAMNYIHALRDILGYPPMSESGGSNAGTSEESDLGKALGILTDFGDDV